VRHEYPFEQNPTEDVDAVLIVPDLDERQVRRGVQRPTWERAGTIVVRGVRTTWGPGGMVVMRVADNVKAGEGRVTNLVEGVQEPPRTSIPES
jgi:hypothetical protein